MSRILLVTQSTRSYGEFRRPWVRALYQSYVAAYRRRVMRAAASLGRTGEVTILSARELLDPSSVGDGVRVRYYDEESYKVDSDALAKLTRHLVSAWWPTPEAEPCLTYRGIWLPELLTIGRSIVLRMEVVEPLGMIEQVCAESMPDRVAVLTGASIPERLARLIAERRGLPVETVAPGFAAARVYARTLGALHLREERLRIGEFLRFPRTAPPGASATERILCVTCRPRHHQVVDPLTTLLRADGLDAQVVAAPNPEPALARRLERLRSEGVPTGYLTDYLPAGEARALVKRYRPVLKALWRRIEAASDFSKRVTVEGLPLRGVVTPFLRNAVERSLLMAVLFQEAAFRALDAPRPSAVVITSTRRLAERALALAARQRGIPSVLFSGALMLTRDRYPFFDTADRVLVIGEQLRQQLVREEGIEPRLVSVVGDPRSDAARRVPRDRLRAEVFGKFGLALDRPLLLFISKYVSFLFSAREKETYYRTMRDACARLPRAQVLIKAHPNENFALLRRQVREWGWPDVPLTQDYDIHRLYCAADLSVMVTSMAGVEAMALGCPVIAVQEGGKDYEGRFMFPYVSEGAVERVDMGDPGALADAITGLLDDGARRAALVACAQRFASRYIHPVDGGLAQRLMGVVSEIRQELAAGGAR
jgi:glycosyltransferase involved in cell wall biosynthesis